MDLNKWRKDNTFKVTMGEAVVFTLLSILAMLVYAMEHGNFNNLIDYTLAFLLKFEKSPKIIRFITWSPFNITPYTG